MSDEETGAALVAGTRIGGVYEIDERISEGAMGAVYRGHHDDGRPVAVKRLLDLVHIARFDIEASLLAQLDHPRVVDVLDHFEDRGGHYLVMELVDGDNVIDAVNDRGLPGLTVDEVSRVGLELCEALDYLHAQHIVHRDVKPDNVILNPDKGAVLVDFGIARQFTDIDEGTVGIGTPRYMAPEVFAGGIVSARSDVFGLAATLWTMATGSPPMYGDLSPLDEVAGLSEPFKDALRGGLAIDPHERLHSAAAMAEALGGALEGRGAPLARVVARPTVSRTLLEALVRAAAVSFEVAAASIALIDERRGDLVYEAAWGTGADEIAGVRLAPGEGIAGAIAAGGEAETVADCRTDPRFARQVAAGTGFVPHTMMVLPLVGRGKVLGVLQFLERRDGEPFDARDLERAEAFADLAIHAVRTQELATQPGE